MIRLCDDPPRVHAAARPEALALRDPSRQRTWGELDRAVSGVANRLREAGITPRERVAVLARDSVAYVEALLGIARARGVAVPINWRLALPEVRYILEDSGARLLLVDPDLAPSTAGMAVRVLDLEAMAPAELPTTGADPGLPADEGDLCALHYTSGTTGRPKGVMLPHRSFFAVRRSLLLHGDPWIDWEEADRAHSALPLFHIGGAWWLMSSLFSGSELHLLPHFDPAGLAALLRDRAITVACLVPSMIHMLVEAGVTPDGGFPSLRTIVYGGAPIPLPQLERAREVLGCGFAQIYGLTETGNTAVCLRPEDHERGGDLLRAAGRPYPGVRVKVVGPDGVALPAGQSGEICLDSPANMLGYWRNEEATRATLQEGHVHTGDGGYVDDEGFVFVGDRIKDMIICAGEKVFPAEVESALCEHPSVAEAAVIGRADPRWGETVHAVLVARGAPPAPHEILRFLRGRIANFKIPRTLSFRDALPRTSSGKIQKHLLRAEQEAAGAGGGAPTEDEERSE